MKIHYVFILAATLLSACSTSTVRPSIDPAALAAEERTQRILALDSLLAEHGRLRDLAQPIKVASLALCAERVRPALGWLLVNKHSFAENMRPVATEYLNLGPFLSLMHATAGGSAELAGLVKGDVILQVNDFKVTDAEESAAELDAYIKELPVDQPLTLQIQRADQYLELLAVPQQVCDYPVILVSGEQVNAFADGDYIAVTRGMMRFAQQDIELQTVLAHELAHNVMKHIESRSRNSILGVIFDIFAAIHGVNTQGGFSQIGRYSWSQEFEAEADYVGLYAMARAELDIASAPNFWRRMAARNPDSIGQDAGSTHPTAPERFVALANTVAEIQAKQKSGQPLLPERTQ